MTDYYTADLHLGHRKVAEIRGFLGVEDHDYTVMGNLRDSLNPGDRLWILGDISGGRDEALAIDTLDYWVMKNDIELHLISGNHDSCHPMHRHSERVQNLFQGPFTSVDSMGTFRHRRAKIMLSHFPYGGDHTETERYPEYRLRDLGVPIIHGHTHSTEKVSYSPQGTLQICVSLDAWGLKPVPRETLTALIDQHQEEP